jgi:hypothetical protein
LDICNNIYLYIFAVYFRDVERKELMCSGELILRNKYISFVTTTYSNLSFSCIYLNIVIIIVVVVVIVIII